ncbi:MAG: hypothetical protein KDK33_13450, partial [Leptospiraceae bacterium]|nr:hypothetical protein [Leptospiraceae bacterium]
YERNTGRMGADEVLKDGEFSLRGVTFTRLFDASKEGMGADVMTIDPNADFGHINAIIRVLQGYLQKAFEYKEEDAAVVARYIVYYNARLRADASLYKGKYSDDVIGKIVPEKAGIDRSFKNWAGNTQIIIPLKKNLVRPGETDVNRPEITKEDSGINEDDKTDMNRIDEDRKNEDNNRLDDKKEEITKQQEELDKKKEDTGKKLEELQKDPVKNADKIEETKQEIQKIDEQKQELEKQKEEVTQQQEENNNTATTDNTDKPAENTDNSSTDNKPAENNTSTTDNTDKPATNEDKKEEVATNTTTETTNPDKPLEEIDKSDNVIGDRILFLRILRYIDDGHYNNELWTIDPKKDDALEKSPYTNICGREFVGLGDDSVVVIGYSGSAHDSSHNLVTISAKDLLKTHQSAEEIFWRTPMIARDGKVYAFMKDGNNYYLGRWNADLTLDAKSSDPISQNSDVTFYGDKIYLTGKSGTGEATTIQVFNASDLKLIKTITPPSK